ncbi:hypothetical protein ACH5RR_013071 [Cinchona calisaya]|uniref:Uncharacterized protein n=1 Tax=Cinchona calisaya TaxID=153742 RepID=A0ABD2ZZ08_9GENT
MSSVREGLGKRKIDVSDDKFAVNFDQQRKKPHMVLVFKDVIQTFPTAEAECQPSRDPDLMMLIETKCSSKLIETVERSVDMFGIGANWIGLVSMSGRLPYFQKLHCQICGHIRLIPIKLSLYGSGSGRCNLQSWGSKVKRFRFEAKRLMEKGYEKAVKRGWEKGAKYRGGMGIDYPIKECMEELERWSKVFFGNVLLQENGIRQQLKRSKTHWLKDGDRNTKFFHTCTSSRRRINTIEEPEDEAGEWCSNVKGIEEIIMGCFSCLFIKLSVSSRYESSIGDGQIQTDS